MTNVSLLRFGSRNFLILSQFRKPIPFSTLPWQACRRTHKHSGNPKNFQEKSKNFQEKSKNPLGFPDFPHQIRQPIANVRFPIPKETIFRKIKKFFNSLELQRRLAGEASVPYGYKRVLKMKTSDKQPVTADLVYTFSHEGIVKSCTAAVTILFILTTATAAWWYFYSGFEINKAPSDNIHFKNPIKFNSALEYGYSYLFVCFIFIAVSLLGRQVPLRIYFDKTKDTFSIMSINVFGRKVKTNVKAGMIKQKKVDFLSYFFGDTILLDDKGRKQRSLRISNNGFITPWYYNHLTGSDGDGYHTSDGPYDAMFEIDDAAKITSEDRAMGEDFVAEKLARLNAEKLETIRRLNK